MKTAERFCCALAAALACCAVARAEDALDSVEKKILAQAEKAKTLSAKITTSMDMQGKSMTMKSKSEGTYEHARRGDKLLFRMESKSTGTTKLADQPETKDDNKTLVIADGQFITSLTEIKGQKTAVKMKQDAAKSQATSKDMWENMRKSYELKLLPDEKVDGKEAYVIRATPKQPKPGAAEQHTYCFAKDSGTLIKTVSEMDDGTNKTRTVMTMTDLKINPDLKAERFVFKAPEGVQVMDMTQMDGTAESPKAGSEEKPKTEGTAAPAADEKKPEQPTQSGADKKPPKKRITLPGIKNPLK